MGLEEEIKRQKKIIKEKGAKVANLVKDYGEGGNGGPPKGERICTCKRCKKEFEQDYVPDRNAYTDWKTCAECRKILVEAKTKKVKTEEGVSVATLPYDPFPWQIEAAKAFETHRFIVLSCGNRTGLILPLLFRNK